MMHAANTLEEEVKSCEKEIINVEIKSNTEKVETEPTDRRIKCSYCPKTLLYNAVL